MNNIITLGMHGILAQNEKMDWIGHDIANIRTPAYNSHKTFFSEMRTCEASASGRTPGVQTQRIEEDWSSGSVKQTQTPTDLAIEGKGMFPVARNGETLYTRAGNFMFDKNSDGPGFVLSRPSGEILADSSGGGIKFSSVPATFSINPDGTFGETGQATPSVPRLQLQLFANPETLTNIGNGLYKPSTETINHAGAKVDKRPVSTVAPGSRGSGLIQQGALEESNVDLVKKFSELLVSQRIYQANSRSISTGNDMLKKAIQDLA
ncbi:MAG: flagellar hook basal-body protein [Kiritimatiellia bacterium]